MFFEKFNVRKMHSVIFQLQLGVFSAYFLFSFSCLNSFEGKEWEQILRKAIFKKICVPRRWFLYSFIQSTLSSTISCCTLFI